VLTPIGGAIDPACEHGLQGLERRGYPVRRVHGFSAIDFGRSVLASAALVDSFSELLWIDSDVVFQANDVERLRGHGLPIVCGIYPKKTRPEFACEFLHGTPQVVFGKEGGLCEIRYAGFGFMLTRREVFETMCTRLKLPECNQRFGKPIVPYFMPMLVPDGEGQWYLSEDYAFCERARQCGFQIMADTSIRLAHVGSYGYSWEDVGHRKTPFATYRCNFNWASERQPGSDAEERRADH
jgi:hypothetical protein